MKNQNGKVEPQLILLDHGLYTNLDTNTRLQYSYLWKGILTQNETLIKDASESLDVKDFWPLFASMVVSKSYDEIMASEEKDMHDRLKPIKTKGEKSKIQALAQQYAKEITMVLHHCNKDVLLFKVNDFLRTLNNQLGAPIKNFEITAKYCFDAIAKVEEKQQKACGIDSERFKMIVGFIFYRLFFLNIYAYIFYQSL